MGIRKRPLRTATAALVLSAASILPAKAQWSAHVSGPDVFGSTTVVAAVTSGSQDGLVVQCNDKDTLDLAYLSPGTKSELDTMSQDGVAVPVELFVKVDQGGVQKLDAVMKQWNNRYVGFVASGRTPDMVAVVKAIAAANKHISIGVEIAGKKQAESFDAAGSTSAMSTAVKDCKLDAIKASPEGDSGSVK